MAEGVKIVVVGDCAIGKTSLLQRKYGLDFPSEYVPTIFDNYVVEHEHTGTRQSVSLGLWDVGGGRNLTTAAKDEQLRSMSYSGTDLFLLCYAVDSVPSLDAVRNWWHGEVGRHKAPHPQGLTMLVGLRTDTRNSTRAAVAQHTDSFVPDFEARALALELGCIGFAECSALQNDGVEDVFNAAVTYVLAAREPPVSHWAAVCALLGCCCHSCRPRRAVEGTARPTPTPDAATGTTSASADLPSAEASCDGTLGAVAIETQPTAEANDCTDEDESKLEPTSAAAPAPAPAPASTLVSTSAGRGGRGRGASHGLGRRGGSLRPTAFIPPVAGGRGRGRGHGRGRGRGRGHHETASDADIKREASSGAGGILAELQANAHVKKLSSQDSAPDTTVLTTSEEHELEQGIKEIEIELMASSEHLHQLPSTLPAPQLRPQNNSRGGGESNGDASGSSTGGSNSSFSDSMGGGRGGLLAAINSGVKLRSTAGPCNAEQGDGSDGGGSNKPPGVRRRSRML